MAEYQMWGIYTSYGNLEQWTRETGAKMEAIVDNEEHNLTVEYFDNTDPRNELYGFTNFPVFVAVKYNQPFKTIVGKLSWNEYENWVKELNWKLDV